MIAYLLKSACYLAFLLAFYHLVLEREKMHQFNRFYLLGSILFSFFAPLFIIYTQIPVTEIAEVPLTASETGLITVESIQEKAINYWSITLGFSAIISLILTLRFGINLFKIFKKVKSNTQLKTENAVLILVEDAISPHTFWNYIFINKKEYNSHKIEDELFTHELTHVTQKHTFDVLLIEVLKIVFWFNPLFYFLKKSIQLNHEFIADEKVINSFKNISEYQYLLLNKAAWNNDYYLASNLNYSLTKKRLVMMTTKTSKVNNWLKKLAVIPLLMGSIYVFAERVETYEEVEDKDFIDSEVNNNNFQKESIIASSGTLNDIKSKLNNVNALKLSITKSKTENQDSIPKVKRIVNRKKGYFTYTDKDGIVISKKISELTEEEKKMLPPPPPPMRIQPKVLNPKKFEDLKNASKYAIWIDGKVANNKKLNNYKSTDFYSYSGSFVHKNARSNRFPQEYQFHLYTSAYVKKKKVLAPPPPKVKELKEVKRIKKAKAPKPVKIEVIEVPSKSKKRVKAPKSAKVSATDKLEKGWHYVNNQTLFFVKDKKGITYYNRWGQQVTKEGKIIKPIQVHPNKISANKRTHLPPPPKSGFPKVKKGDVSNIPPPPKKYSDSSIPPPPPMSAEEMVFRYPKAKYYVNNKSVSHKKAIAFVKHNKEIRVLAQERNGKKIIKFSQLKKQI